MSGRCSAISVQSIDPENSASMCVYAWPAPGLNRCRSYQLLMLGISSIPSRCARPKIGADWPCVSGPSRSTSKPASSRPNPSRQCRDRRRLEADLEGEHRVSRGQARRPVLPDPDLCQSRRGRRRLRARLVALIRSSPRAAAPPGAAASPRNYAEYMPATRRRNPRPKPCRSA